MNKWAKPLYQDISEYCCHFVVTHRKYAIGLSLFVFLFMSILLPTGFFFSDVGLSDAYGFKSFFSLTRHDLLVQIPTVSLLIFIGFYIFLHAIIGAVACFLVMAMSVFSTLGLSATFYGPLQMDDIIAPFLLMSLSSLHAVHVFWDIRHYLRRDHSKMEAIEKSFSKLLFPMALTSLALFLTFLEYNTSPYISMHHLGYLMMMGVVFSFFYSVIFLPALLATWPERVRPERQPTPVALWMRHLGYKIMKHHIVILWGLLSLVLFSTTFLMNMINYPNAISMNPLPVWQDLVYSALIVSFVMAIFFQNIKAAFLCFLPNISAVFLSLALWDLAKFSSGKTVMIVMGLVFGLMMNNTIHFLAQYRHGRENKNQTVPQAIDYAFSGTGNTMMIKTLIISVSMLSLAWSQTSLLREAGPVIALFLLIGLVTNCLMMPAMLYAMCHHEDHTNA